MYCYMLLHHIAVAVLQAWTIWRQFQWSGTGKLLVVFSNDMFVILKVHSCLQSLTSWFFSQRFYFYPPQGSPFFPQFPFLPPRRLPPVSMGLGNLQLWKTHLLVGWWSWTFLNFNTEPRSSVRSPGISCTCPLPAELLVMCDKAATNFPTNPQWFLPVSFSTCHQKGVYTELL